MGPVPGLPIAEVWEVADPLSDYIKIHNRIHGHGSPRLVAGLTLHKPGGVLSNPAPSVLLKSVGQLLHYSSRHTTDWLLFLQGQGAHSYCKQHLHLQTTIVRMFLKPFDMERGWHLNSVEWAWYF